MTHNELDCTCGNIAILLSSGMKTTLDLPDDLYRQVKSKAATDGRSVRDVTIELFRLWLAGSVGTTKAADAAVWLDEWVKTGAAVDRTRMF
jgi:plasmid stability protein